MRDIDYGWGQYGLYEYVPAPYNYYVVSMITLLPFMLVCGLLCCIVEDDEEIKPQYANAQVSDSKSKSKKGSGRAEKLD